MNHEKETSGIFAIFKCWPEVKNQVKYAFRTPSVVE